MKWRYEKYDKEFKQIACPTHDTDGSLTGKVIINLPVWFDENPEERIRLGWIKHYYYDFDELEKMYDRQTQFVVQAAKMVDEYTIRDEITVFDKTEDMLAYEEIDGSGGAYSLSSMFNMIL